MRYRRAKEKIIYFRYVMNEVDGCSVCNNATTFACGGCNRPLCMECYPHRKGDVICDPTKGK